MIERKENSIVLLIILNFSGFFSLDCFTEPFPKVLGSLNQYTMFNALDVHIPTGDLVAVGHTLDPTVKGACTRTNNVPIIVYYSGLTLK